MIGADGGQRSFCEWGNTVDLIIPDEIKFLQVYIYIPGICVAHANSSREGTFDKISVGTVRAKTRVIMQSSVMNTTAHLLLIRHADVRSTVFVA